MFRASRKESEYFVRF